MNSLSSLELIRSHEWTRSFFTTYALSLSFFEAVVLDALLRQGVEQSLIMADITGVAAALAEEGVRGAGRAYQVEPVAVSQGCFHPKLVVLTSSTEAHLLVGSGNLTFGGWGSNLECVEHIHAGVSPEALNDAAEFFELLASAEFARHSAELPCRELASILRRFGSNGTPTGRARILHNLARPIFIQIAELASELGGAERLTIVSPFYDGGLAVNELCRQLGLDRAQIHAHHAGVVRGSFGSNWPKAIGAIIEPVEVESLSHEPRPLHAKMFEIACRGGRIVLSGSANSTMAGLDRRRNVELCVARIDRNPATCWHYVPSSAPAELGPLPGPLDADHPIGVLRAVFAAGTIKGEILTKFSLGVAKAGLQTGLKPASLGEADVSSNQSFELPAPSIEIELWKTQRLVLRLESATGEIAQGFVAFPAFGYIAHRAGPMRARFFALLTATDTPEDIAAIISYFLDNPAERRPEHSGGGGSTGTEIENEIVVVADLIAPSLVALNGTKEERNGEPGQVWQRFLQDIFACFRQSRGPIESDKGRADPGEEEEDDIADEEQANTNNIGWPVHLLQKLVDMMLVDAKPDSCSRAFWMTHYVCDRIAPDIERVAGCLAKIVQGFTAIRPKGRDIGAVAGAVLVLAHVSADDMSSTPLSLRRKLRRLGVDVSQSGPDLALIPGFHRVLAPNIDAPRLWTQVQSVTTVQEEITAFRQASKPLPLDERFPLLRSMPELGNLSRRWRTRLLVIPRFTNVCPHCHVTIPTAEAAHLRDHGVVIHDGCGRIILNEDS